MATSNLINLFGTIVEAGEQQVFTFEGVIGDRIFLDGLEADFENITLSIISPTGATITSFFTTNADTGPFTLTETGTYQIIIDANSGITGDYNLNLLRLNFADTITFGTNISGSLTPGLQTDAYRFTGTKGQRLQFDNLTKWSKNSLSSTR